MWPSPYPILINANPVLINTLALDWLAMAKYCMPMVMEWDVDQWHDGVVSTYFCCACCAAAAIRKGIKNGENICCSQTFFSPHTNSIINPISFLPMPNVTLCLSYSWLRAESVGFGQKNVNWSTLGYGWPSCVSASRLIKRLSTPYIWPKTRSSRADTVHKRLSLSSACLLPDSNIPHWVWRENIQLLPE